MSTFSNADTGSKVADPYTQKNLEEPSLKEKAEDLFSFIDKTKFCLLTTQTADSDLLASRAMALAAKVGFDSSLQCLWTQPNIAEGGQWFRSSIPYQH